MACLSTSGRQGLFVAVGSRRYHNQRFVCQLMLTPHQQNYQHENNHHRKNLGGSMANNTKCNTTPTITASRLLSCSTSASLSNAPLQFQQPKRYFHGFNQNTTTTATSVFNLMVSQRKKFKNLQIKQKKKKK